MYRTFDDYPTEAKAEDIAKQVNDQIIGRVGPGGTPWHEISQEDRTQLIADTKTGMLQVLDGMKVSVASK